MYNVNKKSEFNETKNLNVTKKYSMNYNNEIQDGIKIKTITLERIFVDKLFAAESYFRKSNDPHKAFEAAKHIYDLTILEKHNAIIALFENDNLLEYLLKVRLKEEKDRHDGIPGVLPKEFEFFTKIHLDKNIFEAYLIMQKQYVLRDEYKIDFYDAINSLVRIKEKLQLNPSWFNAILD